MTSGTPVAVVVDEPKLERMSERTTPVSSRTLGWLVPCEPSPGYGPAVSSGMREHDPPVVPSSVVGLLSQPSSFSAPRLIPKLAATRIS